MNLNFDTLSLDVLPPELGKPYSGNGLAEFQKYISLSLCKMNDIRFPGSQPVSMDTQNIKLIQSNEYVVCEKSDGVRYLLFLYQNHMYYIDRNYLVYSSSMPNFPENSFPKEINPQKATLLDGELIIEKERLKDGQKPYLCYWVFDILAVNGFCTFQMNLYQRLQILSTVITGPMNKKYPNHDFFPFHMTLKPMFGIKSSEYIWKNIVNKTLHHGCDGLIFTPVYNYYTAGTCQFLLKWKPFNMNSVDFQISGEQKNGKTLYRLLCNDNGIGSTYSFINLTEEEKKTFAIDGQVVECVIDPERYYFIPDLRQSDFQWVPNKSIYDNERGYGWSKCGWKPIRVRKDKTRGNYRKVADSVIQSIRDNLDFEVLWKTIQEIN